MDLGTPPEMKDFSVYCKGQTTPVCAGVFSHWEARTDEPGRSTKYPEVCSHLQKTRGDTWGAGGVGVVGAREKQFAPLLD